MKVTAVVMQSITEAGVTAPYFKLIEIQKGSQISLWGFKASVETSSLPSACFGCVPEAGYSPARV